MRNIGYFSVKEMKAIIHVLWLQRLVCFQNLLIIFELSITFLIGKSNFKLVSIALLMNGVNNTQRQRDRRLGGHGL